MRRFFITVLTLILLIGAVGAFIQGVITAADEPTVRERFGKTDIAQYDIGPESWEALLEAAERDERLISILEHIEVYSEDMVKLAVTNEDARDFAADYWQHTDCQTDPTQITLTAQSGGVPLLTQWDSRWGYDLYGGSPMGLTGCGPTCLSMVAVALTGDTRLNPLYVAHLAEENGWYVSGSGSSWDLMRAGASELGLNWRELGLSEENMRAALGAGEFIICSMLPGDFTTSGHFIVIDGCTDGGFSLKDPNSLQRSARLWSYDELAGQIAVLWAYSRG